MAMLVLCLMLVAVLFITASFVNLVRINRKLDRLSRGMKEQRSTKRV